MGFAAGAKGQLTRGRLACVDLPESSRQFGPLSLPQSLPDPSLRGSGWSQNGWSA